MTHDLDVADPRAIKTLLAAGAISGVFVKSSERGLFVVFRLAAGDSVLGAHRGGPRYFQSFDGVASVLKQHGISEFSVDTAGWTPKTLAKKAVE
ncbi:ParC family partition-associated protein [Geopseudomonas aromaticivorans]